MAQDKQLAEMTPTLFKSFVKSWRSQMRLCYHHRKNNFANPTHDEGKYTEAIVARFLIVRSLLGGNCMEDVSAGASVLVTWPTVSSSSSVASSFSPDDMTTRLQYLSNRKKPSGHTVLPCRRTLGNKYIDLLSSHSSHTGIYLLAQNRVNRGLFRSTFNIITIPGSPLTLCFKHVT